MKINARKGLRAVTFSANGEHLLSGGRDENIEVWQVQDGQRLATMETIKAEDVRCLAVSKNGKWIARGVLRGDVSVCDAETYEAVWKRREHSYVNAVDFSPDSTRLVSGLWNGTATIWDVASGKKVR